MELGVVGKVSVELQSAFDWDGIAEFEMLS